MIKLTQIAFLLIVSSNSLAGTAYTTCAEQRGFIKLEVKDDIAIESSSQTPIIVYTINLKDAAYPNPDSARLNLETCIDGNCVKSALSILIMPGGLIDNQNNRFPMPIIYKGNHTYSYQMSIPRYGCDIKATANILIK